MPVIYGKKWTGTRADFKRPMRVRRLNYRQKNQVKTIISRQLETKYFYGYLQSKSITNSMSFDRLTAIPQGDQENERVGEEVVLRSLKLRYTVHSADSSLVLGPDDYNLVRVIVFQWRNRDTVDVPSQSTLLRTAGPMTGFIDYVVSPHNKDSTEMYKILYDKRHLLTNDAVYDGTSVSLVRGAGSVKHATVNIPLKKIRRHLKFSTDSNAAVGHLYIALISDSSITPHPTGDFTWEIAYKDG